MKLLELFCGKAIVSEVARSYGIETITADKRKRSGVCSPDFHLDLLKVKNPAQLFGKVDLLWASPPCQCWSNAPGSYHFFEGKPQTKSTKTLIKCLDKTLWLIEELKPQLFFIENPRGKLRYYKKMIDFLVRNNGMIKQCMYSDYGFQSQKPTNIFTNCHDLILSNNAKYGRGAKANVNLNNLTTVQRQEVPRPLADTIIRSALIHVKKYGADNVTGTFKMCPEHNLPGPLVMPAAL